MIAYAAITNTLLMTLYSMNNMPYSALGGVMTGDLDERAKLNSFRFVAVNIAQFVVGGFTLPLVAKFAAGPRPPIRLADDDDALGRAVPGPVPDHLPHHPRAHPTGHGGEDFPEAGLRRPAQEQPLEGDVRHDPRPFCHPLLPGRRALQLLPSLRRQGRDVRLRGQAGADRRPRGAPGGLLETLGYIVHGDKANLAGSNVADVFNSIINMVGTATTIIVIILSPPLSRRFGKKAIAVAGFGLASLGTFAFYLLSPANVVGMVALTILIAICYAPTIPLVWAIFADVADYSEWKTGRRFTGMVFATIGFALKSGLALGSASFLWIMAGLLQLRHQAAQRARGDCRLPFHQRDRRRPALRHLHRPVASLQAQQGNDDPDGR